MTLRARPPWSIEAFVRARREFDDGHGPPQAWVRLNETSLWRLDELAERAGSRTWAMFVAPPKLGRADNGQERRLLHALSSVPIAASASIALWLGTQRVSMSRVVVAHGIGLRQAVRLALRYDQLGLVHIQRIPFEYVVVRDMLAERDVELRRFEPAAIADSLAQMAEAEAVVVVYRCTTIAEGRAMAVAEQQVRRM